MISFNQLRNLATSLSTVFFPSTVYRVGLPLLLQKIRFSSQAVYSPTLGKRGPIPARTVMSSSQIELHRDSSPLYIFVISKRRCRSSSRIPLMSFCYSRSIVSNRFANLKFIFVHPHPLRRFHITVLEAGLWTEISRFIGFILAVS